MNLLKMEFYKLRHRKMGLMVVGLACVQLLYMMWATKDMTIAEQSQGWKNGIYSFSTLNAMMMPLFIAVIASRISDIEHKGNTFKSLKTITSSQKLLDAKILCGGIYLLSAILLQVLVLFIVSKQRHFTEILPVGYLIYYVLSTFIMSMILLMLQLNLSLIWVNQMIAFMVAIAGAFLGLYSMFFSEEIARWILWGYYALLSPVRMNWDETTRIVDFYWTKLPIVNLLVVILGLVSLYIIGRVLFVRRES